MRSATGKFFLMRMGLPACFQMPAFQHHSFMIDFHLLAFAVAGRLDFSLTPSGLKVYEYNADSASCLMQCGEIQVLGNVGQHNIFI